MRISKLGALGPFAAIVVVAFAVMPVLANDEEERADESSTQTRHVIRWHEVAGEGGESAWIGVMAEPASEALKSQLKIERRLVVQRVLPDSPAADAGIKEYDVLLQFGDEEIESIEDLVKAVQAKRDNEADMKLLRRGKKMTITVTPTKRPKLDVSVIRNGQHVEALGEQIRKMIVVAQDEEGGAGAGQAMRLGVFGPALMTGDAELSKLLARTKIELPENLTISITKKGKAPTKVTVSRDGETWEIVEEELSELPEDVRPHVEKMLGRNIVAGVRMMPPVEQQLSRFEIRTEVDGEESESPRRKKQPQAIQGRIRRIESIEKARSEGDALDELRSELKALRSEIENLKEKSNPKSEDGAED